ncbi:WD40-repeat-containing domain protein [Cladochytrium replicatum]|nr:WD40-repeat-containing domain protein [Cladochytrium replicatum]
MITSLSWVRRGAAAQVPKKYNLSDEEYERIAKEIGSQVDLAREGVSLATGNEGGNKDPSTDLMMEDAEEQKSKAKQASKLASTGTSNDLSEFKLDDYDDEDNSAIPGFSNIKNLAYYSSNTEDPYIQFPDEKDEEEEIDELQILPTDLVLVAAKTGSALGDDVSNDNLSHVEVYVYEDVEDNLYVHHDVMLPSFPLCVEWLDFHVGRNLGSAGTGNYVAVGTMEPEIEIWNLDTVEVAFPDLILGASPEPPSSSTGKKKKKKKQPVVRPTVSNERHTDAVLSLSWNQVARSLLASGSADKTIKLWDLTKPEVAFRSFSNVHSAKVQSVQWHPKQQSWLLSGGYDQRACMFDTRVPDKVFSWKLTADVECMKWDPFREERFYVSTEDGLVRCYDIRAVLQSGSAQPDAAPLYTIHAHDEAVSALDINPSVSGMLVTGSPDKKTKIWDVRNDKPQCVASKDVGAGRVFAARFCPDSPASLAVAGGRGTVVVWNMEDNAGIRRTFGDLQQPRKDQDATGGALPQPRAELTMLKDDDQDDSEDEGEAEQMIDEMAEAEKQLRVSQGLPLGDEDGVVEEGNDNELEDDDDDAMDEDL